MNAVLDKTSNNLLSISLRLVRMIIGLLLLIVLATETNLSNVWQLTFAAVALYTLVTALSGRDPVIAILKFSKHQLPDQALSLVAQVECLSIGLLCIIAGILNHHSDSLVLRMLPFVGIYPIILCAVKYDLLGYLLRSYRKDLRIEK